MSFKLRSSNPVSTPLTWTEMDNNLNHLLTNMSGSNVNITGSTGIKGNTSVSGTLVVNNTLSVSNTSSVNHIHPTLDIAYDLGKSNARWNNAYIKNAVLTTITASFISGSITNSVSSSYATTSSYIKTAQTASYVITAQTASYVITAQTASYVINAISSSYSLTASSILGGAANYVPFWSSSLILSSSIIKHQSPYNNVEILGGLSQGQSNILSGTYTHIEGFQNTASGDYCHAEGYRTNISVGGTYAHTEGFNTIATDLYCHAEGYRTLSGGGEANHTEGYYTTASGDYCHAEGYQTYAKGNATHAEGLGTISSGNYQHVSGKYNIEDGSAQTLFIVGNGTGTGARSDAFKVRQSGSIVIQTGSAAPTWAGVEGELKPYKSGANYFIACYIGGAWRSSSLS